MQQLQGVALPSQPPQENLMGNTLKASYRSGSTTASTFPNFRQRCPLVASDDSTPEGISVGMGKSALISCPCLCHCHPAQYRVPRYLLHPPELIGLCIPLCLKWSVTCRSGNPDPPLRTTCLSLSSLVTGLVLLRQFLAL